MFYRRRRTNSYRKPYLRGRLPAGYFRKYGVANAPSLAALVGSSRYAKSYRGRRIGRIRSLFRRRAFGGSRPYPRFKRGGNRRYSTVGVGRTKGMKYVRGGRVKRVSRAFTRRVIKAITPAMVFRYNDDGAVNFQFQSGLTTYPTYTGSFCTYTEWRQMYLFGIGNLAYSDSSSGTASYDMSVDYFKETWKLKNNNQEIVRAELITFSPRYDFLDTFASDLSYIASGAITGNGDGMPINVPLGSPPAFITAAPTYGPGLITDYHSNKWRPYDCRYLTTRYVIKKRIVTLMPGATECLSLVRKNLSINGQFAGTASPVISQFKKCSKGVLFRFLPQVTQNFVNKNTTSSTTLVPEPCYGNLNVIINHDIYCKFYMNQDNRPRRASAIDYLTQNTGQLNNFSVAPISNSSTYYSSVVGTTVTTRSCGEPGINPDAF